MELNWSTFVLEIINFLVLAWILKRFLYRPVLEVIARRRAGIEKTMADANALRTDAATLQAQYEGRLAEWVDERQRAREQLARELEAERAGKLAELQTALEQEREKTRVAESRRQADTLRRMEEIALARSAVFATRLLEQSAGPETEARLVEMMTGELDRLPDERVSMLRNSNGTTPESVTVASAFPLADEPRRRLEQALHRITGPDATCHFTQDRELLAGLQITIGDRVLAANIRDELAGFAALAHDE